jgi:hypothetical protein
MPLLFIMPLYYTLMNQTHFKFMLKANLHISIVSYTNTRLAYDPSKLMGMEPFCVEQ